MYYVRVSEHDGIKYYNVIRSDSERHHSAWRSLQEALQAMRDLNRTEKRLGVSVMYA